MTANAEITRGIRYFQRLLEEHDKTWQATRTRLNGEISKLRALCPHPAETLQYNPDPSGNNDTSYTCGVCGLERRRF